MRLALESSSESSAPNLLCLLTKSEARSILHEMDKGALMRQGFRSAAAILFFVAAFSPAQALVIGVADPGQANSIPFGQTTGGFVYQHLQRGEFQFVDKYQ